MIKMKDQKPLHIQELFNHSEGLICLLGGIHGPLSNFIFSDKIKAPEIAKLFKKYFANSLFMEIYEARIR